MIFSLTGKITHKHDNFFVLEVNNIGYQIFATNHLLEKLKINQETKIFTYLYRREDREELYGFITVGELNFFKELLPTNGVGPKIAQAILSLGNIEEIKKAIQDGNVAFLHQVHGIGKKTAERIIVDFQGKIEKIFAKPKEQNKKVVEALKKLGYQKSEIDQALQNIPQEITDTAEQIKFALKNLSQK